MIFFVANDGTVIDSVPSPVYQGAANANNIYLVAPFAENLQASVAFKLPNGVYTKRYPMVQVNKLTGIVDEKTGKTYNGWQFSMPNEITQYFGTVTVQFFFYAVQGGVITATSSTSFVVDKGVPSILPSTPNVDVYEAILDNLSIMSVQLDNGAFAARAIYQWNSTYVYGAGEITYYADFGEYGAFVKSLKIDNTTEPFTDGVLNSDNWLLVSDFNILTELYDLQENTALSAKKAAQSASEAAKAEENAAASASASAANLNLSVAAAQAAGEAADRAEGFARYGIKINTDYSSVNELPADGNAQNIYLIPNGSTGNNSYDEYLWSDSKKTYEKLGTTEIDLSDYLTRADAEAEYWRALGVYQGDLNDLYTNGVYRLGASATNLPSGETYGSQLIVTNSDISCSQIYILFSTGEIYSRGGIKNSGVWSPWVKNANEANVVRKSGDTMTGALTVNGNITSTGRVDALAINLTYSTPFIDFHYDNSTDNYSARLICDGNNQLTCKSNYSVEGKLIAKQGADFLQSGNEFNFATGYDGESSELIFNYKGTTTPITTYRFCTGSQNIDSVANIVAKEVRAQDGVYDNGKRVFSPNNLPTAVAGGSTGDHLTKGGWVNANERTVWCDITSVTTGDKSLQSASLDINVYNYVVIDIRNKSGESRYYLVPRSLLQECNSTSHSFVFNAGAGSTGQFLTGYFVNYYTLHIQTASNISRFSMYLVQI